MMHGAGARPRARRWSNLAKVALSAALALSFGFAFTSPATAAPPSNDQQIAAALKAAGQGDTTQLETLLSGPLGDQTRTALHAWLVKRGDFTPEKQAKFDKKPVGVVQPLSTGEYDYYCTSYSGVTMGWNGKDQLACHGWLDVYISGNHVGHVCPDLIPRGGPITLGCALAAAGAIVSLIALPATGVGWVVYGAGVAIAGPSIVNACP